MAQDSTQISILILDLDEIKPNNKLPTFLEEYSGRFDNCNEAHTEIEMILEQYGEGDSGRESSVKMCNTLLEKLGYNNALILAMSDSSPFLEEAILEFVAQQKYISNSGLHTHQIPKVQFGKYLTK